MALLRSNLTVSLTRLGQPVPGMQAVRVYRKPPGPMNLDMTGVQSTTDLLADPGTPAAPASWQVNDVLTLVGAPAYQVQQYTVESAIPPAPGALLPVWRIRVKGAIR